MDGRFPQPSPEVYTEVPNSDFIGVINSLALSAEKKENIIKRVQRLEKLNWSKRAIANELEIRFHIKIGETKKPTTKPH